MRKRRTLTTLLVLCLFCGYEYINSISFRIDLEASEVVKFYKANTKEDYTYPIVNQTSIVEFSYSQ